MVGWVVWLVCWLMMVDVDWLVGWLMFVCTLFFFVVSRRGLRVLLFDFRGGAVCGARARYSCLGPKLKGQINSGLASKAFEIFEEHSSC